MNEERQPYCIWLYGMPNAGKTTISYQLLQKKLRNCILIDGDKFREHITPELSFSKEDILNNNSKCANMVNFLMEQGYNVLVAMITPYNEGRVKAKEKIKNLILAYVDCSKDIRSQRPNFMDSQIPFEEGIYDVLIPSGTENVEASADRIIEEMKKRGYGSAE